MLESAPTPQEGSREAWKLGRGPCVVCGTRTPFRHHVVYQQHVRKYAPGREWELANGIRLCQKHHQRHHDAIQRIRLEHLPDAAIAFAQDVLGEFAELYLKKRYDGDDPRLRRRTYDRP